MFLVERHLDMKLTSFDMRAGNTPESIFTTEYTYTSTVTVTHFQLLKSKRARYRYNSCSWECVSYIIGYYYCEIVVHIFYQQNKQSYLKKYNY